MKNHETVKRRNQEFITTLLIKKQPQMVKQHSPLINSSPRTHKSSSTAISRGGKFK